MAQTLSQIGLLLKAAIFSQSASGEESRLWGLPCGISSASPVLRVNIAPDAPRTSSGPRPTK